MILQTKHTAKFMRRINFTVNGCWNWTGAKFPNGYGMFSRGHSDPVLAHRAMFELSKKVELPGIDSGLMLNHLCRNKSCVRPSHLELVTNSVNQFKGDSYNASKTHCPKGHEYTPDNTYYSDSGMSRKCRTCVLDRVESYDLGRKRRYFSPS